MSEKDKLGARGFSHLPHILVVDDDLALGRLLSRCLVRAGYDVTFADNAIEAMGLCSWKGIDVILSDVDMPGTDGHQLARWVAANHPKIRCVLMSGLSSACDECPLAGRCLLLRKPFSPPDAVALIASVIREGSN